MSYCVLCIDFVSDESFKQDSEDRGFHLSKFKRLFKIQTSIFLYIHFKTVSTFHF